MTKLQFVSFVVAWVVTVASPASAWEVVPKNNSPDVQAVLGMRMANGLRLGLIIDFTKKWDCRPSLSVLEFTGENLVGFIGSALLPSEKTTISAGSASATFIPYVARYSNGVERICNEEQCGPVILALTLAKYPPRVIFPGRRVYEFPLVQDASAIQRAQSLCERN